MIPRTETAGCAVGAYRLLLLCLLGILCCEPIAHAAGLPLSATFRTHGPGRSGAPRSTSITMLWNGTALLEGDLLVEIVDGRAVLSRSTIADIAIAPGEQTLGMLLPPTLAYGDGRSARAKLTFLTRGQKVDLGTHPCSVPGMNERVLSVLYPVPVVGDAEVRQIAANLRPDWLNPEPETVNINSLRSGLCPLRPDAFPSTPEEYCASDLVVLAGAGIAKLRVAQLDALHTWVRAGGSICVVNPHGLPETHQAFITRLFDQDKAGGRATFGPDGGILGRRLTLQYEALGRAALLIDRDLDADTLRDDLDWRHMLAFVWKARASQETVIINSGMWDPNAENEVTACAGGANSQMRRFMRRYQHRLCLQPIDCLSGSNYLSILMPRDMSFVRIGPLALVLGILVFFVGPFDYFVLKRFRLQRFTWITVPVYVGLATFAITALANHAMGRYDRHGKLCVLDTDARGIPVRQNDIHLMIPSHHGEIRERVQRALVAPVRVGANPNAMIAAQGQDGSHQIGGRYPYDFEMTSQVSQWRPIAWRTMSLRPIESFPWRIPHDHDLWSKDGVDAFWQNFQDLNDDIPQGAFILQGGNMRELRNQPWKKPVGVGDQRPKRLAVLAEGPRVGYLSIVSSISPTCGPSLEDLPVYDISDPQQAVLILVWREKDRLFTSRTPFYRETPMSRRNGRVENGHVSTWKSIANKEG